MDINTLVKLTNQKLAGETLLYSQLEPYFDDVIDKINTELNAIFPTFSEHRERNQTDSGIPAYTYFPDMYIRSVVVVGAAVGFYTVDEEGIITAQQMQVEYNTNLFMMKRDYSEQVPEQYKATGRGYLTGGNFYVNTDCKQCMSANNGHCPKTCGIMDLFPELRYVPIQGPPGPAGVSVIAVSDIEPTDKACKIWIKAYEDYAEVYTRNSTGAFVYLTKILSKADVDKLQNAVSFDGTITLSEVNSEQCHTNRGVFKILTSDNNTYGGILMAWHIGPDTTANRQLLIKPTFQGTSMIQFRKYANGVWQPWKDVIDTASYSKATNFQNGKSVGSLESVLAVGATSEGAIALGKNSIAGGKGFSIISCEKIDNTTGRYVLDSVSGLEIGMSYSVKLARAKYKAGTITAIDTANKTITVNGYPDIALDTVTNDDEFFVTNYFFINERPDLGTIDIAKGAITTGEYTIAQARSAYAEGLRNIVLGEFGHAEGRQNIAGYAAHAEGLVTEALGDMGHSEGYNTKAKGRASHAEGNLSKASGETSHAEGHASEASGNYSHTEGYNTKAKGRVSHAEGVSTIASGLNSHAEGVSTTASGEISHAEGSNTIASGPNSHAEGVQTIAEGRASHAEGGANTASGTYSHTEGYGGQATGSCAHTEGGKSIAQGEYSHTEGYNTNTTVSATSAHAEGSFTKATAQFSHAEGRYTIASGTAQHVQGKNNIEDTENKYAHIVGNGITSAKRSNAHTLDWDGNAWYAGSVEATAIILKSSTEGSSKKFKITVDDSGTLSATEI